METAGPDTVPELLKNAEKRQGTHLFPESIPCEPQNTEPPEFLYKVLHRRFHQGAEIVSGCRSSDRAMERYSGKPDRDEGG